MDTLQTAILVAVAMYFAIMVIIGLLAARTQTNGDFVIAANDLGYLPVIGSLAASFRDGGGIVLWIGFGITIGFGGIWLMLGALAGFMVYAVFGPRVRRIAVQNRGITVGEMIRESIGPGAEVLTAAVIVIFSLAIVAIQFHVAGSLLAEVAGVHSRTMILICAGVVGIYLCLGGFNTVVRTDVIQFVLILSLVVVVFLAKDTGPRLLDMSSLYILPAWDRTAMFVIGFLYPLGSADAWQKLFAARNNQVVRWGFPLSGIFLILMTATLIWIGMGAAGVMPESVSGNDVFFRIFQNHVYPAWFLVLLAVAIIAITMSTIDTFSYLLASSLHRNLVDRSRLTSDREYIRFVRIAVLCLLALSSLLAITINDIMQAVFDASSLLLILAPLYTLVGFGWHSKTVASDRMVCIALLLSVGIHLAMFFTGMLSDFKMLLVPAMFNMVLLAAIMVRVRSDTHA